MAKSAPVKYEVRWRQTGTVQWGPISSIDPTAEIVVEGLDRTKSYDFEVRAVSSCGARSAWVSSSQTLADVAPGTIVLSDLKTEVDNAAADAAAANAELANIASDNVLSQGEKPVVIRDYNVISTEQAGIDAQASSFGITTEKTAYDNAVTALTSYLGTLTSPTAWNNLAGDTTIVGTIFRQKFADVYTTRQALLNAIYAAAKARADGAQSTANNAASTKPVINPQFLDGLNTGWTYDNAAGFYVITNADTPDSAQQCHLGRNGQSGAPTTVARNLGYVAVQVGQTVIANCCIKAFSCNAGAAAQVRISWRDSNHTELSVTLASVTCGPGGTYLQCVSKAMGQAPASAQFAHLELYFSNHTSGYFTATSANLGVQPSTIDEVPDGQTNARTLATRVNGGKPVIDFSEGIHFNKQLDNIGDGTTYYRMPASNMDGSRRALIDFSQASHLGKVLDNIGDGTNYGRPLLSRLSSGNPLIDFAAGYHLNKNVDNIADGSSYARAIQAAQSEIVDNGSFEVDAIIPPTGWKAGGIGIGGGVSSVYFDSTYQYSGTRSFVFSAAQYSGYTTTRKYSVVPGETWLVSAAINNVSNVANSGYVAFVVYDKNGNIVAQAQAVNTNATAGFYVCSASVVIPSTGAYAYLGMLQGAAGTYQVAFDAIKLARVRSIDSEIADGSTFARIKATELSSGVHKLGVAGSGALLGNQLNAPNSLTLNYGASRTATAVTATSAGVASINAFTFKMGGAAVSYNAVSNAVTGLTVGVTYQIYCHDAGGTGGTKTWYAVAGTQTDALSISDDVVIAGQVTIPSSGSSGGGGTGCPVVGAWVIRRTIDGPAWAQAGDVVVGDELLLTSGYWGRVSHSRKVLQPCVQVRDENGFTLSCSSSAPLGRTDGSQVLAPDAEGELIESRTGMVKGSSRVAGVRDIGEQWVQHITCENDFFWVGDQTDRLFSHHNLKP